LHKTRVQRMQSEDDIKKLALELIAGIAPEADITNLDPTDRLRNQFDFDSVDFMNFAVGLEQQLNLKIPEEDYPQLATLKSCVAYLKSKMDR